jgi:hypothetical protein
MKWSIYCDRCGQYAQRAWFISKGQPCCAERKVRLTMCRQCDGLEIACAVDGKLLVPVWPGISLR